MLRLKNGKTKTPEHEVLLFRAAIDYDFEKQKQPGRNYDLAYFGKTRHALSPLKTLFSIHWSPLNSNFLSEYDFFEKDFAYFDFSLSLDFPLNLKLSYGLNYKKTFEQDSNFTDVFSLLTKEFAINLAFIENSYLNYAIRWKDDPFGTTSTLSRTLSLKYQPASNCWGVQASWTKGDEQDKFKGSYFSLFILSS